MTDMPLFIDADEGFGRPLQTFQGCRRMARAGADAILVTDLAGNGKLGLSSIEDAVYRFRAAKDGMAGTDCLLLARCDHSVDEDFDEFVERCNRYLEAGADMICPLELNRSKIYGSKTAAAKKVGEHVKVLGLQVRQLVEQCQVRRQVVGDALAQGADGLADGQRAAVLLAGQEQELGAVGAHRVEEDAHRGLDHPAQLELVAPHRAQGLAEGLVDVGHQGQAQGVHIGEVPVETGRDYARRARHFAQAQAAEAAAAVHQAARGVHQGLAGLLFLFGAGRGHRGFHGRGPGTLANGRGNRRLRRPLQ